MIGTTIAKMLPPCRSRGQSFVELALFTPILLLVLAGMVEVVFVFNAYLQTLDAARNAARFVSDNDPYPQVFASPGAYDTIKDCNSTQNFFRLTACVAQLNLQSLPFDMTNGTDDIVISIFASLNGGLDGRYDNNLVTGSAPNQVGSLVVDTDDSGWSFAEDQTGTRNQNSRFAASNLGNSINAYARNTGFIMVEVVYAHYQILSLPFISNVLPNPIVLHAYAVMPLVAAEPTATPRP